jgi:hypothetical protein
MCFLCWELQYLLRRKLGMREVRSWADIFSLYQNTKCEIELRRYQELQKFIHTH